MLVERRRVTQGRKNSAVELPVVLNPGTARLARYVQSGIIADVEAALPLARRGGHGVIELFALAVLFLSVRERSIRGFYAKYRRALARVAAVIDRRSLPSGASVSRALGRLRMDQVHDFGDVLLASPVERAALLTNPAVQHRDSLAQFWHVFDFDPTTRPFRQRDLPRGDDLPEPERRAQGVPGYMGRKRGDIRQQDHLLQHAGSGLWCSYRINAAGGSATPYFAEAVRAAREWTDAIEHPPERVLVRADGEFGHAAAIRAAVDRGVHHLVRIARYHLFDRPEVVQALGRARWLPVPGSMGKVAADLGLVMLHDTDGAVEPIEVRVIVTRRQTQRDVPRHGFIREGWQFETFATSLPADAWPAPDVVALYAGRSTIENSFAQEDSEYELERTFSFNPAGQAFFVAIGLFLWNDAVCRSAAATNLPAHAPLLEGRQPEASVEWALPETMTELASAETPLPHHPVLAVPTVTERYHVDHDLKLLVIQSAEGRVLPEQWRFDADRGVVRCPTGSVLHPFNAEVSRLGPNGKKLGQDRINFRSAVGICDGCVLRTACTTSTKPNTYRQMSWIVPHDRALSARGLLASDRLKTKPPIARRRAPAPQLAATKPLFRPTLPVPAGPYRPLAPTFSPGAARAMMRGALERVFFDVVIRSARRRRRRHPLLKDARERSAMRLAWSERRERARVAAIVLLRMRATSDVARLLAL